MLFDISTEAGILDATEINFARCAFDYIMMQLFNQMHNPENKAIFPK